MIKSVLLIGFSIFFIGIQAQKSIPAERLKTNSNGEGTPILIEFEAGEEHNHPTFAIWVENMEGDLLQTLYVTESLATGTYQYGELKKGIWKKAPDEARRPSTLPYWLHKRGVLAEDSTYLPTPEHPISDAITSATPQRDFILESQIDIKDLKKFRLFLEINQAWDWNKYWHNSKYPDDKDYATSCQPALVYAVTIDLEDEIMEYYLNPIGHSHYSGENGNLYTNLSSITTALQIVKQVKATINKKND